MFYNVFLKLKFIYKYIKRYIKYIYIFFKIYIFPFYIHTYNEINLVHYQVLQPGPDLLPYQRSPPVSSLHLSSAAFSFCSSSTVGPVGLVLPFNRIIWWAVFGHVFSLYIVFVSFPCLCMCCSLPS